MGSARLADRLRASPNAIPILIPIPDTASQACLDPMQQQFSSAFQGTIPVPDGTRRTEMLSGEKGGRGPGAQEFMDDRTSETELFSCSLFLLLCFLPFSPNPSVYAV